MLAKISKRSYCGKLSARVGAILRDTLPGRDLARKESDHHARALVGAELSLGTACGEMGQYGVYPYKRKCQASIEWK